jgi:hypothetical protein
VASLRRELCISGHAMSVFAHMDVQVFHSVMLPTAITHHHISVRGCCDVLLRVCLVQRLRYAVLIHGAHSYVRGG